MIHRFATRTFAALLLCSFISHAQNFWQKTSGPADGAVNALLVTADGIFAAADSVYFSSDNGTTWAPRNNGMKPPGGFSSAMVNSFFLDDSGNIYATTGSSGVFKSTNKGTNWVKKSTGTGSASIYAVTMGKTGIMLCGGIFGGGVFRSTNKGESWSASNTGLTDLDVQGFVVAPNGNIFAATDGSGVFRSTDNGATWAAASTGMTKFSSRFVVATSTGDLYCNGNSTLFKSTNNGDSWTNISLSIATATERGMVVNSLGHLYVTMDMQGILRTTDGGTTWEKMNSGLDDLLSYSLALGPDERIYTGTKNSKVVYIGQSTLTEVETKPDLQPEKFVLHQNYPNPFNPTTAISFKIHVSGFASLKVFDILGKEIATLVNEHLDAGSYTSHFYAANQSSGMYFYQLRSGHYVETKRMMLLK